MRGYGPGGRVCDPRSLPVWSYDFACLDFPTIEGLFYPNIAGKSVRVSLTAILSKGDGAGPRRHGRRIGVAVVMTAELEGRGQDDRGCGGMGQAAGYATPGPPPVWSCDFARLDFPAREGLFYPNIAGKSVAWLRQAFLKGATGAGSRRP